MGRAILSLAGAAFLLVPSALPAEGADAWYLERGTASWYGEPFHGLETASGEVFDMNQLTAAHRELPFGAEVRVIHLRTGASITVVINDRGPCIDGRDIDLSKAAARALGMVDEGLAPVLIEADLQQLAHAGRTQARRSRGC
ncbi:MAG TPA: septal ring lytic transglycosylase RlpA family protein [Geminicoccaceae bacterium]|jgi:rare lipoprotein A|nr:septal ring lytic transglycosylase RlpA family protein [Geminicoccaceae bacterium]